MKKTYTLLYGILNMATGLAAFANIGNYEVLNGPLGMEQAEHATIVMARENVICTLKKDRVNVKASFTFNNNGPATEAVMYFPVGISSHIRSASSAEHDYGVNEENPVSERPFSLYRPEATEERDIGGAFQFASNKGEKPFEGVIATITTIGDPLNTLNNYETLKNFRVFANGAPVNVEIVERFALTEGPDEGDEGGSENKAATPYAKQGTIVRWRLYFSEGEKKEVKCEYEVAYYEARYVGRPDVFIYSIRTGKAWAGTIGEGLIEVKYSTEEVDGPVSFSSPGLPPAFVSANADSTTISWTFNDFEPKDKSEIKVLTYRDSGTIVLDEEDESIIAGLPGAPGVVVSKGVDFKKAPSPKAKALEDRAVLPNGSKFSVIASRGEWWQVRLNDGTEGWMRWRSVDPDTGEERIYAAFAFAE